MLIYIEGWLGVVQFLALGSVVSGVGLLVEDVLRVLIDVARDLIGS